MDTVPVWFERKFDFTFPVELHPNLCARLRGTHRGRIEAELVLHAGDHRADGDVGAGRGQHDREVDVCDHRDRARGGFGEKKAGGALG